MRFVQKNTVIPADFLNSFTGINAFSNLYNDNKQAILSVLINEQKGLCVYCNQKITVGTATIEHLICQSHNHSFDLNYYNLLAVCKGNQGVPNAMHCDKYRSHQQNDYFLPFFFFEKCITTQLDKMNPFFDVEYNRRADLISGKIIAKEQRIDGFPGIRHRIEHVIDNVLNLNAPILKDARKAKWESVLITKAEFGYDWYALFDYFITLTEPTNFHEFVLLAIRKQIP